MGFRLWNLALGVAMAAAAFGLAANPPTGADVSAQVRTESLQYAEFMERFLEEVRNQYFPKVGDIELLEAAVQGLYEAARQPLPANLREELNRPGRKELLARLRADLGNHEAVRDIRGPLVSAKAVNRVLDPYCGFPAAREFRTHFDRPVNSVGIEFANGPIPAEPFAVEIPIRNGIAPPIRLAQKWPGLPDTLLVKTVIAGSPAQRVGIRPGDLVTKIDGKPCSKMEPGQYQRLLATTSSDQLRFAANFPEVEMTVPMRPASLEIRRSSAQFPLVISLEPTNFAPESVFGVRRNRDESWDYIIDDQAKLGYVRIGSIVLLTPENFRTALKTLQSHEARGLVLDLRWCPGGYLKEAKSTAMSVLPPDVPVSREVYRIPPTSEDDPEPVRNPVTDLPIVVLINGDTMGGGELIAASLQDHGRANIAGERTFGKGSIQSSLNNIAIGGLTYKLTKGTFMRPNGKNLHRFPNSTAADDWGVRPDEGRWLPLSPDAAKQLKEQWTLQTLRPGNSREALPTDDPETDPQLRAALAMLRNKLKN